MADNELLQKILTEMQDMKAEMQNQKKDILEIKQKINRIEVGQSEMKRELFRIDRKISDTYNLSLDALGMSTETKEWLESGSLKA